MKPRLILMAVAAALVLAAIAPFASWTTVTRRSRLRLDLAQMLRPAAALLALGCLFLAGCGGSAKSGTPQYHIGQLVCGASGGIAGGAVAFGEQHASVVAGSSDYQPGRNRVSFLVVDAQARVITTPTATVWVATGLTRRPYRADDRAQRADRRAGWRHRRTSAPIFVTHVRLPRPGKYWVFAAAERRARSRRPRSRTSSSRRSRTRLRSASHAIASDDADACQHRREAGRPDHRHPSRPSPLPPLRGAGARQARSVRAHVRDPEVLPEPTCGPVSTSSMPSRRSSPSPCPLHPRRDLQGQRSGEGLQPLGERSRPWNLPTSPSRSWSTARGSSARSCPVRSLSASSSRRSARRCS